MSFGILLRKNSVANPPMAKFCAMISAVGYVWRSHIVRLAGHVLFGSTIDWPVKAILTLLGFSAVLLVSKYIVFFTYSPKFVLSNVGMGCLVKSTGVSDGERVLVQLHMAVPPSFYVILSLCIMLVNDIALLFLGII